ncbi:MAG: hypothetical protein CVV64_01340 [Candidatus Wallbacteria bacterium HGW-Wallbacteria-1]|uniref:DUF327 domain-containing protein n=1 Tax=Candidatus Wallbacteria bacterium HGW-Wallbacteria-1 TaxID=2013854 RepID=A0A2N1PUS2_9BACT|nr:MAG: hypothetical protein CVV64_01340 [Candidatus Wallbacteria bacterium HGW-Wallbacteria-1]
MKVQNRPSGTGKAGGRAGGSGKAASGDRAEAASFTTALSGSRERLRTMRIESLIAEVDRWGSRLRKSPSAENVREYRERVRDFMSKVLDEGLALDTQSANHGDKQKVYVRVEKVNRKLVELTDELLGGQAETLGALDTVDEIRGLLLDLVG